MKDEVCFEPSKTKPEYHDWYAFDELNRDSGSGTVASSRVEHVLEYLKRYSTPAPPRTHPIKSHIEYIQT